MLDGKFVAIKDVINKNASVVYKFTLNIKKISEKFQVLENELSCTVEQFDRPLNKTGNNRLISLRTMDFKAVDNYSMIVDQHGFYEVACDKKDKRLYEDQYFVLPYNMSKLIDERMAMKPFTKKAEDVRFIDEGNSLPIDKKMNVLIIRIDSLSYSHFKRALPKLYNYLNNELKNNVFFTNANSVGENTHPNMVPFLSGVVIEDIESLNVSSEWDYYKKKDDAYYDPYPFIWYEYENKGYLTGYQVLISFCNHIFHFILL